MARVELGCAMWSAGWGRIAVSARLCGWARRAAGARGASVASSRAPHGVAEQVWGASRGGMRPEHTYRDLRLFGADGSHSPMQATPIQTAPTSDVAPDRHFTSPMLAMVSMLGWCNPVARTPSVEPHRTAARPSRSTEYSTPAGGINRGRRQVTPLSSMAQTRHSQAFFFSH